MRDEGSEEGGGTDLVEGYRSCELHGWTSGSRDDLQFWHTIKTSVANVARIHRAKFFHCLRSVSAGVNHAGIWSVSARDCMREGGRSSSAMGVSWGRGRGSGSGRGSGTCRNVNRLRTSTDCLQIIPSTRRSCGARHYVMRKQITAPAAVHVIDNDTSASPYHTAMSLRDKSCYTLTIHPYNTDPAIFELIESVGPATGNEKPRYARVKETREDESYSSAIYGMYR